MVFLLGRMGNNKKALGLIIERMGDVQRVSASAIDLALETHWIAGYRLCQGAE